METTNCGVCNLLSKYANGENVEVVYESDYSIAVHSQKKIC